MRRRGLAAAAAAAALAASPAAAQISGAVVLESEFRLRGFSLTDGRPALSASIAYDHPSGLYAGASAVVSDVEADGLELVGRTAYAGYALQTRRGVTWDAGVATQTYFGYGDGRRTRIEYDEVYVGGATERLDLHLRYSPDYIQHGVKLVYLDLNGNAEPWPDWRVFGHLGLSRIVGGDLPPFRSRQRWDARAGVARRVGPADVSIAWTRRGPGARGAPDRDRTGVVLGASLVF